jgi:HEAT repeats
MSEVRRVAVAELRQFITDSSELSKGTELADKGGLAHLAKHANKVFADAAGSGASPYKTQIVFGEGKITGRCSCMAARTRPFCKHAAALLVSWARTPEAFAVAEAPPAPAPGQEGSKRATVKRSKVDAAEAIKKGVEQASTVLSELWQTGVFALAGDRAEQVSELATSLRELGLRRLSARTLDLAALLRLAAKRDDAFPREAYASLVADMWLTVRKLEKHLAGEALADEHVEELIGRTWTKKDRKAIAGLMLAEYSFLQRTTPDGFLLRESRLIELESGEHYSEKQIIPAAFAKRIAPKVSYSGRTLRGASGSVFPSFAPKRLDLETPFTDAPIDAVALRAIEARALPSVSQAIAALAERRRDVFAPAWIPACVRVDLVVPSIGRLRFIDGEGGTLFLAGGREEEDALVAALDGAIAVAVLGDVALEGALPCLFPLAILTNKNGDLALIPLGAEDATAVLESKAARSANWANEAKAAGASQAALMLGEVRDDLAGAFQEGVVGISTRFLDPLAERLRDLQLLKQADALAALAGKEATDKLDGLVKLYQVLGIALTRLVGTAPLDRTALVPLATMASVAIVKPAQVLTPEAALAKEAQGAITRYERMYHIGAYYNSADAIDLLRHTDAHWGNGFAIPFVLRAALAHPALAIEQAVLVLSATQNRSRYQPMPARLAMLTALRILTASSDPAAHEALRQLRGAERADGGMRILLQRALGGPQLKKEQFDALCLAALSGSTKEDRERAIDALAVAAAEEAIPTLRAAQRDKTNLVRRAAAYGLASLGATEALDTWVAWLEGDSHDLAKIGVHAIGLLGDTRGAGPLLQAYARGFSPSIVNEALVQLGPFVLGPLLDLAEGQPELVKRTSLKSLVKQFPPRMLGTLTAWIESAGDAADRRLQRAKLALDATSERDDIQVALIDWIVATYPTLADGADKESKALKRKLLKQPTA